MIAFKKEDPVLTRSNKILTGVENRLSPEQAFFLQKYREMKSNSPDKHDELAKSFIALVGTLTTLYFAAVTFSKIPTKALWFRTIALTPVLLWLLAIISALITFGASLETELSNRQRDKTIFLGR